MQLITKNNSLFLSRVASFLIVTVMLGQLNLWVSASSNALFIILGRVSLVASPLIYKFCRPYSLTYISLLTAVSLFLLLIKSNNSCVIILACTLSLLGYFQKLYGSYNYKSAGNAKIAANVGGLMGGLMLFFLTQDLKSTILIILFFTSLIGFLSNAHYEKQPEHYDHISLNQDSHFSKLRLAWCLFGIAIGIKFYAIFTLLPQILIRRLDNLPSWYGIILVINTIGIILGQKWVIQLVKSWELFHFYIVLLVGFILIALTPILNIEYWLTAVVWTLLLTFIECILSAMDSMSALQGSLLYKEVSIGIGGALVALFARSTFVDPFILSFLLGLITISLGYFFYNPSILNFNKMMKKA
jgi:hypothetical protein